MSKLRSVNTQFWSDPWVEDLTPSEKLLYLYFITNEKTNMLGVYELSIKKISFETGIDKKTIEKALKGFERIGKVKYTNNFIVLLNFTKHQNYNTNMKKSAIDIFNNLPKELNHEGLVIDKQDVNKGFERVRKGLGMVRKIEVEYEDETELEDEEEKPKKTIFNFRKSLIDLGVEEQVAEDWMKVRKNKNATNTETSFKRIKNHIVKSGKDPNECISLAVAKDWKGFEAQWIINENKKENEQLTKSEQRMQQLRDL
jgi:hypothetical protein